MTPEVQALFDILREVGFAALFAWLFVNERRDRTTDRLRFDSELAAARAAHMADIREIAGLRQGLFSVNPQTSVPRDHPRQRDTGGISVTGEIGERDK